ncbi:MAG: hypothetical protein CM15mP4_3330 [Candidatus Neomarinimicrobiota bacterium]|nr:MAG: hypothetical protein CM15mP4_3330 [Candidatus Neomarinimicrobiota bacterium]
MLKESKIWKVGRKAIKLKLKNQTNSGVIIRADPVFMIVLRKALIGNLFIILFYIVVKNEVNHQRRYLMLQKMSWLWGHEWGY